MKKLHLLFIGVLSMSTIYAQDITDALRFSQDNIQGTARFRALSGAFGALGGDLSGLSLNPAGSAVFSRSHASFTLSNSESNSDTQYYNGLNSTNDSNFNIDQGGFAFVFASNTNSPWRKFSIGISYEKTSDHDINWIARGTNTDNDPNFNNSIASYFYDHANGKRLDQISALPEESLSDAYQDIGFFNGFSHQQAFLGYESFILEPENDDNANTVYTSNISPGNFDHDYTYASTGYNGKITFNLATQYKDNLYLGVNLNSHFINYERSTLLFEDNNNAGSIVNSVEFRNNLSTTGNGFSFQLGGILKLTSAVRLGLTYNSPIWYTIEEETTQFLATVRDEGGSNEVQVINPDVVNVLPQYKLQTPAKITGSFAYVFGKRGLISFDYSRKDYSKTKFRPTTDTYFAEQNNIISNRLTDAATYRIGGEYKHEQFSFRGGYRLEESPYKDGFTIGDLNGYSFGVGYNFGNTKLDITYDHSERSFRNELYRLEFDNAPEASIDNSNSNITLSLSFNI
ncbi:OmpP1/FadL family transporter [Flavivirga eckloniae]|uniref:Transporter n=1 Tax=Flavivirga eckloniae TaxID=1803846 RepID=A0A2K9PUX2_9FLAO|nr:outer membrane protein transport protein [Flavivirga eckloniae]AUP80875.1 transporter [Flavivirga eckloniae]